ncbi:acetyl-CoA C-acetyltransferase [Gottschalkiaceae bacterium SANA]|nr:acetyl-CoA C-acetyltransferase [Gottschalkiaceae bacterium SANA]
MDSVYIVSSCRTAVGTMGGALKDVSAVDLGVIVATEAMKRANIQPQQVDEVMFGCVLTGGQGQNVARQIAIKSGIPETTTAYTLGMVCGSGMKTVIEAIRAIRSQDADIIMCGGTENMSASPYVVPTARFGARLNNAKMIDTLVNDGLWDAFNQYHMGITAENICDQWNLSREELDAFALQSQQRTAVAQTTGKFEDEIVPVAIKKKREIIEFKVDEHPRNNTSKESLAKLRPAFIPVEGRVTAGNSSGINDGAAAIIVASGEAVKKYNLKPIVKIVGWGQGGVDPSIMGIGPVPATRTALEKASLSIGDIDLVEANEAFAAQSIAVARELEFDMSKVNVNGGAISLGHPIGCSGARIVVTLLHEMMKRPDAKRGLATLCIGGGMGVSTIFEKIEE